MLSISFLFTVLRRRRCRGLRSGSSKHGGEVGANNELEPHDLGGRALSTMRARTRALGAAERSAAGAAGTRGHDHRALTGPAGSPPSLSTGRIGAMAGRLAATDGQPRCPRRPFLTGYKKCLWDSRQKCKTTYLRRFGSATSALPRAASNLHEAKATYWCPSSMVLILPSLMNI